MGQPDGEVEVPSTDKRDVHATRLTVQASSSSVNRTTLPNTTSRGPIINPDPEPATRTHLARKDDKPRLSRTDSAVSSPASQRDASRLRSRLARPQRERASPTRADITGICSCLSSDLPDLPSHASKAPTANRQATPACSFPDLIFTISVSPVSPAHPST